MRPHALTDGDGAALVDGDGELLTILGDDPASQQLTVPPSFPDASEEALLGALQMLLPRGLLWRRDDDSNLTRLLRGIAAGLLRMRVRILRLRREFDPRSTLELLPEWEALLDLPDPCIGVPSTLQERRMLVATRWTAEGGQSPAYYIDLAGRLGIPVTIEGGRVFRLGPARTTARHSPSRLGTDRLNAWGWAYTWIVHAPAVTRVPFRLGQSTLGERLLNFGNVRLECVIRRAAPAHTVVNFVYGD